MKYMFILQVNISDKGVFVWKNWDQQFLVVCILVRAVE